MVGRSVRKFQNTDKHLFTSESVTMGHPDKVADHISDAILDAMLAQDPGSRVACETLVTTGLVVVAGEITTKAIVDIPTVVRETIQEIGYTDPDMGFDFENCAVMVTLDKQSPDISQGVTEGAGLHKEQGAGDQGLMFGYACKETPALMPMPIQLAHGITTRLEKVRQSKKLPWLRPDGKSQVTVEYMKGKPRRIHTVVVASQHAPAIAYRPLRKQIIEQVVLPVLPKRLVDKQTILPTAAEAVTGAGRSAEKTPRRWTGPPATWPDTSPKTSLPPTWPMRVRFSCLTPSEWLSPSPFSWIPKGRRKSTKRR